MNCELILVGTGILVIIAAFDVIVGNTMMPSKQNLELLEIFDDSFGERKKEQVFHKMRTYDDA